MTKSGSAGAKSAKAQDVVEKTNRTVADKALKAGKEAAEKATKAYDQALGAAKRTGRQSFPQAAARFDDLAGLQRANLEALFATGTAAMRSAETLSEEMLAFNRKAFEEGVANAKKLFECKTMREAVAMQTELACAQIETTLAQAGKFTDLALKMAGEIAEPMQDRFNIAVETLGKPLAA